MWRKQSDAEPTPTAQGAVIAVASVLAIGLLVLGVNELYVSRLAPTPAELEWLKTQRVAEHESLPGVSDADVVTLQRSECGGSCPAYQVSLWGSGRIEFRGDGYVCRRHVTTTTPDTAAIARLIRGLEVVRFDSMPSYEHQDATDRETVTVTLSRNGSAHSVRHYYGDSAAPRVLNRIEERIDKLSGAAAWTGSPGNGTVNCTLPDGKMRPVAREVPDDGA